MSYMNRAMALAFVIAAVGCVPAAEKTEVSKTVAAKPVVLAAAESSPAMDIKAMETNIKPGKNDGRFFDYY